MKVNGIPVRTIRSIEGRAIEIIDQTRLPWRFERRVLSDWRDCVEAIASMRVRGASLIGVTGAWAIALATQEDPSNVALKAAAERIRNARPTAVTLSAAVHRMMAVLLPREPALRASVALDLATQMLQEDVMRCRAMGEAGAGIITALYQRLRRPINVLTHGNAGWLSTVDYGTALAPVYEAFERGIPVHVWIDETRPRNQGLLSAWELNGQGIPHTLITDNAGGQLMQHSDVDLVLVGADRITRSGDAACKVGSYLKALAARDNDIPFYVVAPSSAVDWYLVDGLNEITIENRSSAEVFSVRGIDSSGREATVQIASPEEATINPAFDVTPGRLITGIITERGIVAPEEVAETFEPIEK